MAFEKGRSRIRVPVSAAIAFARAGAADGTLTSPTPVGGSVESIRCTSITRTDQVGVDVSPAVEREHDPVDVDAPAIVERDLRDLGAVAEEAGPRDPPRPAFGQP